MSPGSAGPWLGSLRNRLLALLLGAVTVAAGIQAAVAYRAALAEADTLFDYHMRQMALSLRSGAPLAGGGYGPPLPRGGPDDFQFIVQIWSAEGRRMYESDRPFGLPERAVLGYSNLQAQGRQYRVFSVQTSTQVIQVAQDLAVRTQMARSLAWRTVAPVVLSVPLLALAVWWVVRSSLEPVQRVQRQLALRQADGLSDVSVEDLPTEVRPLVDELNALLGRLRRAFEAQQAFVADAAHELRSPLAALRLQAQALARAPDEAMRERAASRLAAGLDRASRLVDQLLVLAREEAGPGAAGRDGGGSAPQTMGPVALEVLAREVLADAAEVAAARGIALALDPDRPLTVPGQADALAIALRNLVDNAIRHAPAGGQVRVGVDRTLDGSIALAVDDDGPGIAPADREAALARFHRLPGAPAGGSGLGLAIVQSIARRHGAELRLERSPALGGLRAELRFAPGPVH